MTRIQFYKLPMIIWVQFIVLVKNTFFFCQSRTLCLTFVRKTRVLKKMTSTFLQMEHPLSFLKEGNHCVVSLFLQSKMLSKQEKFALAPIFEKNQAVTTVTYKKASPRTTIHPCLQPPLFQMSSTEGFVTSYHAPYK